MTPGHSGEDPTLRKPRNEPSSLGRRGHRWPPSKRRLEELVEEALVDAYGEAEQRTGLFTMIEEHLALPFETEVLGVTVTVERIDLTDELVAICRRGKQRQPIAILDLPLPSPPPAGAEWIAAYRYWARGM
ncbi:MAG: calcium-binding protein [Gemmatimonadales bacterium]|nr:calcium-binding protein [Gemmatimonadales bacterium]